MKYFYFVFLCFLVSGGIHAQRLYDSLYFEMPIKELQDQLEKCQIIGEQSDVDVSETCIQIQNKLELA